MNELITTSKTITMSSREIAELTSKRHADVMRDIRNMLAELQSANLRFVCNSTSYIAQSGQSYPMYELDRDTTDTLLTGYSAVARMKVIKRWRELENQQPQLPQDLPTALRLYADEVEKNQLLEQKVKADAPKIEFYNDVTGSRDLITVGELAKVLNIKSLGRNKLFALLRDLNVLRYNNEPYQSYVDRGWFKMIETKYQKPNGDICINLKTMVYQKGVDGIRKLVIRELEVA